MSENKDENMTDDEYRKRQIELLESIQSLLMLIANNTNKNGAMFGVTTTYLPQVGTHGPTQS